MDNPVNHAAAVPDRRPSSQHEFQLEDFVSLLAARWKLLTLAPLAAGIVGIGLSFLIAPTFTAKTVVLPPQQQQSTASTALASLGSLSTLAGAAGGIRTIGDQYVSLLQSANVADRIIDKFKLIELYESKFRVDAQRTLNTRVRMSAGKKDGLLSIEVDDHDPARAAAMANAYVEELRRLTATLALTEAQQRRVFFEGQLTQARDRLGRAQAKLQSIGFNAGAIKAEPKAAADSFAQMRAELTAAEVRLQTLRASFSPTASEVQRQSETVSALRAQLHRLEASSSQEGNAGYIGAYRDFKYEETLFDLFARQYEIARADESREGVLIQVVDPATPPERKSKPKRSIVGLGTTAAAFLFLSAYLLLRQVKRRRQAQAARHA